MSPSAFPRRSGLKDHPRPLTEINAHLPRDLARIVDRCRMKDPARDVPGLYLFKIFVQIEANENTRAARETLKKIDRRNFPELPAVESYLDLLDGRFKASLAGLAAYPKEVLDTQDLYHPKTLLEGLTYLAMNDRTRARVACESARQVLEKAITGSPRDARMQSALGIAFACL